MLLYKDSFMWLLLEINNLFLYLFLIMSLLTMNETYYEELKECEDILKKTGLNDDIILYIKDKYKNVFFGLASSYFKKYLKSILLANSEEITYVLSSNEIDFHILSTGVINNDYSFSSIYLDSIIKDGLLFIDNMFIIFGNEEITFKTLDFIRYYSEKNNIVIMFKFFINDITEMSDDYLENIINNINKLINYFKLIVDNYIYDYYEDNKESDYSEYDEEEDKNNNSNCKDYKKNLLITYIHVINWLRLIIDNERYNLININGIKFIDLLTEHKITNDIIFCSILFNLNYIAEELAKWIINNDSSNITLLYLKMNTLKAFLEDNDLNTKERMTTINAILLLIDEAQQETT